MYIDMTKRMIAGAVAVALGIASVYLQNLEDKDKKKGKKVSPAVKPAYIILAILAICLLLFAFFGDKLNSSAKTAVGTPSNMAFGFRFY